MKKNKNIINLTFGILISILFLYFAFRRIDFHKMYTTFLSAHYQLIIPIIIISLFENFLRSVRWYFLLKPIKKIPLSKLFSALLIGYMGNVMLPAHLGVFIRAYIIGHSQAIATSTALATIVIEWVIEIFSLLAFMFFVLILYPFPNWIKQNSYVVLILIIGLFFILILLKKNNEKFIFVIKKFLKFFPDNVSLWIEKLIYSFLQGFVNMKQKKDYIIIAVLSIAIWGCYGISLYIYFYMFNLIRIYDLNIISSLVLLVTTMISIIIPSSPGHVGTYHFFTQISLELFGVPRSVGLSYAIVVHGITTILYVVLGLIFFWKEGLSLLNVHDLKNQ